MTGLESICEPVSNVSKNVYFFVTSENCLKFSSVSYFSKIYRKIKPFFPKNAILKKYNF